MALQMFVIVYYYMLVLSLLLAISCQLLSVNNICVFCSITFCLKTHLNWMSVLVTCTLVGWFWWQQWTADANSTLRSGDGYWAQPHHSYHWHSVGAEPLWGSLPMHILV